MNKKREILLLKIAVWIGGLSPAIWLIWRALTDRLGANPAEELLHGIGDTALILLLTTLAVTPLRRVTGRNTLIKIRRPLGLFAFFYLCMHFLVYLILDQALDLEFILEDIVERPYITVGFTAWVLLIPLAVTSTRGWIRRLGKRWQKLHRLVYVSAALGVLHFYWQVKADTRWPLVATVVLAALLLSRVRRRSKRAPRAES